jgi:type II secretory ATPase GspE/PulE/Tfp pilus assembly ATPase PilB-like protein
LDSKKRNIVTVEDPIEYEFEQHIAQVQVTERMTFARVMRSFLRQDPDVMMVGEMRDAESLGIGIQAALTGHLVLSTLHTNSALETVNRMLDMDAEPYLVSGVTVAILAQRLIRLNCPKCREPYPMNPEEMELLKVSADDVAKGQVMKGKGCPDCRGSGFKGRVGVFELLMGTQELKRAIARGGSFEGLEAAAKSQGFKTMLEDGRDKVLMGWTTPEEVFNAVFTHSLD